MTEQELHRGLAGIPVAETRLSEINYDAGELTIGGFPIAELATNATYEESVSLLYNDRHPTDAELERFRADLATYREIAPEAEQLLNRAAQEEQGAMDALRMLTLWFVRTRAAESVSFGRRKLSP